MLMSPRFSTFPRDLANVNEWKIMFDPSVLMNYQIVTLFLILYLNFIGIKYSFSYTFCFELTYAGFKEQSPWHFNVIIHSAY